MNREMKYIGETESISNLWFIEAVGVGEASGYGGKRGLMGQLGYDENSKVGAGTSCVWLFT